VQIAHTQLGDFNPAHSQTESKKHLKSTILWCSSHYTDAEQDFKDLTILFDSCRGNVSHSKNAHWEEAANIGLIELHSKSCLLEPNQSNMRQN